MARRPSPELIARRRASVPAISFPEQLPVSQRRDEIAEAIRDHQVVIVAGETGSGKTTQLIERVAELVRRGVPIEHIAAITFTEAAAAELQKAIITESNAIPVIWYSRIVAHVPEVKGWKIIPSHFANQDLADVWLDK